MEPSFANSKKKLERHLLVLIGQPIREFQIENEVKVSSVTVELIDVSIKGQKLQIINQIKIGIE